MRQTMRFAWLAWALLLVIGPASLAYSQPPGGSEGVLVGRITHITGKLLRYVPEEKDWVVTVKDAPFGLNDALYSDRSGKAEFVMPNATMIRVGNDTQIQLIALRADVTEMDVASGMARFYNRSGEAVMKTTTPFGYIVAGSGTVFDVYVGDESLEVIALKGTVEFILESDQTRYEVTAGSSSLLSDGKRVGAGEGNVDADWDDWNIERDSLWSKKAQVKGDSYKYIPPPLYDDAYELEEYGRWDRVQYEGSYHDVWRPANIRPGWRPYTVGRWSVYYGDNCWIPYDDEPWGYVTHHYGSWMYVNDYWCWAPPVVSVGVSVGPAVGVGFGWYPGRVGWVGAGVNIGWFPLAPWETYYSHHHWGPGAVVVNNISINTININNYRYADYAVAVPHSTFYSVNNYYDNRIINIDRSTIVNNNYMAAPVVNDRIFTNFSNTRERFMYTNAVADMRPHSMALDRIQRNMDLGRQTRGLSASAIERDVSRFRAGSLGAVGAAGAAGAAQLARPSLSSRLVSPADASRPRSDVQFQQRALGSRVRAAQESPVNRMNVLDQRRAAGRGGVETGSPGQMLQPGGAVGQGRRIGVGESTGQPGAIQAPLDAAGRRRRVGVSDQGGAGTLQPGGAVGQGRRIGVGESTGQPGAIQAPLDATGRRRRVGVSDQGGAGTLQPGGAVGQGRRIGVGESTGQSEELRTPPDSRRMRRIEPSQNSGSVSPPGGAAGRGRRIGAGESTGQSEELRTPPDSRRMRRIEPSQDSGSVSPPSGAVGRGRRIGVGESTGQPGTIQAPPDSRRMRRIEPSQDSGSVSPPSGAVGRGRRIGVGESTGQPGTIQAPPDSGRMRRIDPNQDSGARTFSPPRGQTMERRMSPPKQTAPQVQQAPAQIQRGQQMQRSLPQVQQQAPQIQRGQQIQRGPQLQQQAPQGRAPQGGARGKGRGPNAEEENQPHIR